ELIGQMAIPIMLITLGVAVARLSIGALGRPLVLAALKVGISAACATAAGIWFDLGPVGFGVLVVQVATPVAVTSYMLAEKYGADADAVAGLVVVSTLMSVLTLPVILAFVL
ncbi:MAG: AEC family transporter, partial [Pseudomonadota bacterium]